jgi:hypothetical protein
MDKEKIKKIYLDQREYFLEKKEIIPREIDLNFYIKSKQIVLISGIRRCGKSTLLYLIKDKINLKKEEIFYFNLDDERIIDFQVEDFNKLLEIHMEIFEITNIKNIVLFFDEIQNIKGWERFLNRMYERGMKIFVTGSNAKLLSSEISTSLTGRNLVLKLYPFSFIEFLIYKNKSFNLNYLSTVDSVNLKILFNEYLQYGGFPLVLYEQNLQIINTYYQDILYRDIVARYNLSQVDELKSLSTSLITNIGKLFSYSKLKDITKIKSLSSLKTYLDYLSNSYLLYYLSKFDYSYNKQVLNPKKVYVQDIGFHNSLGFKFSNDKGRILENIIFIELKRRGKEIYYHKDKKECDFVIKEGLDIVEAVQVTQSLEEVDTKKREFDGLLDACKAYNLDNGLILTEDEEGEEIRELSLENGEKREVKIIIKPIWKWLLES